MADIKNSFQEMQNRSEADYYFAEVRQKFETSQKWFASGFEGSKPVKTCLNPFKQPEKSFNLITITSLSFFIAIFKM